MFGEQLNLHKQFEEAETNEQAKVDREVVASGQTEAENKAEEKLIAETKTEAPLASASEVEILDGKTVYDLIRAGQLNTVEDFAPFKKQLDFYAQRYQELNQRFQAMSPGPEKEKLYWLRINPESLDEEKYRGLAQLFIRFQEVKQGRIEKVLTRTIKKDDKPKISSVDDKPKISVIKKSNKDLEFKDDDRPDPYGDIYPFSRRWRQKRR